MTAPALLRMMQDWVSTNGTLLYTYPVDLELKVDPRCTLEIDSFSEPECKTGMINNYYCTRGTLNKFVQRINYFDARCFTARRLLKV